MALADAPMVEPHGLELAGDGWKLLAPERRLAGQAADEDDRKPAAMPLVIEVAVADRDARHGLELSPIDGLARLASRTLPLRVVITRPHALSNPGSGRQPCRYRIGT